MTDQGEMEASARVHQPPDEIVVQPADREDMQRIVENELVKVNKRMKQKGHTLEVDQTVIDWMIEKSFHEDFGARPLKRGIEKHLEDPLSEQILKGQLDTPYVIKAMVKDGEVHFEMTAIPVAPKPEPAKSGDAPEAK
jgi:ATP-dependent Clp protease ATP-binding subunit ClpC